MGRMLCSYYTMCFVIGSDTNVIGRALQLLTYYNNGQHVLSFNEVLESFSIGSHGKPFVFECLHCDNLCLFPFFQI